MTMRGKRLTTARMAPAQPSSTLEDDFLKEMLMENFKEWLFGKN